MWNYWEKAKIGVKLLSNQLVEYLSTVLNIKYTINIKQDIIL